MSELGPLVAPSDGVFATRIVRQLAADLGLRLDRDEGTGPGGRITLKDLARRGASLPAVLDRPLTSTVEAAHASPAARRLAADRGVDLSSVAGSAPGGRIRLADVLVAQPVDSPENVSAPLAGAALTLAPEGKAVRGSRAPLSTRRAELARRAVASLHQSAQLTVVAEVDVTNLDKAPRHATSEDTVLDQMHVLPYVAEAVVAALLECPVLNARLDLDVDLVHYHAAITLGILANHLADTCPLVLAEADTLDAEGIAAAAAAALVSGPPEHMAGGPEPTFTVACDQGEILFGTPLLPPHHTATLSVGAVRKRPMVVADSTSTDVIAVRKCAYLSLTYDNRLVDGADAARFLSTVRERVERARTAT